MLEQLEREEKERADWIQSLKLRLGVITCDEAVLLRVLAEEEGIPHFFCPRCHMTSFNPNDVIEGYCGYCHDWTRQGQREGPAG